MGSDGSVCPRLVRKGGSRPTTCQGNAPFMAGGWKRGTGGVCISSHGFCFSACMAREGEILKPFPDRRASGFGGQILHLHPPLPRQAEASDAPERCQQGRHHIVNILDLPGCPIPYDLEHAASPPWAPGSPLTWVSGQASSSLSGPKAAAP